MANNGPYGDHSGYPPGGDGGQPPYPGHGSSGPQPPYGGGPGPYGSGPQPTHPHHGGPEFYQPGAPGGPGFGGPPPPGSGYPSESVGYPAPQRSNTGLFIGLGVGGLVLALVVIFTAVVLFRGGEPAPAPVGGETQAQPGPETPEAPQPSGETGGEQPEGTPNELPSEPCEGVSEATREANNLAGASQTQNISDSQSYCTFSSYEGGIYTLDITYQLPYSISNDAEAAAQDLFTTTRQSETRADSIDNREIATDEDLSGLGDQAAYIAYSTPDYILTQGVGVVIVRQGTIVMTIEYAGAVDVGEYGYEQEPIDLAEVEVVQDMAEEAIQLIS
ncbi:hypothetical protein [Allonocardiopsis opalescens]|uniref:DUF3558 domain-containing protein n=1 Tax=Allonocardiopsis opalescens TaxID=1144618 RepID=A0A2T0Q0C2_9ACTN|nr:hypothetical protein [Allonocardiopsis opalescens]PRX97216.1 hypothetical protein CLV72_106252 [Allonocardiopsis opalescens]